MSRKLLEVNFDGTYLPQIILGCDPFECYTYFYPSPERKSSAYSKRFLNAGTMLEIASAALDGGINALNFSRHENLVKLVEEIKKRGLEMKLVPLVFQIPLKVRDEPIPVTRIEATFFRHIDWKKNQLYKEFVKTSMYREVTSALPLSKEEIDKLDIDGGRLERALRWFDSKGCVKLAMTCVEIFALTQRFDLIEVFLQIFDKLGYNVCAGSHIADVFEILEKEKIRFKAYYAPLNKIGFLMAPTQEQMLRHLVKMKEPLIAIKPLAGGRIKPREAFNYIFNLRENVVCMVGLSSIQEVEEALRSLKAEDL